MKRTIAVIATTILAGSLSACSSTGSIGTAGSLVAASPVPTTTQPAGSAPATSSSAVVPSTARSASAPTKPGAAATVAADPAHVDARGWLPAASMPLSTIFKWKTAPSLEQGYGGFACEPKTFDQLGATAITGQIAEEGIPASDPHHNVFVATQDMYFFPDQATAAKAFTTVTGDAHGCLVAGSSSAQKPGTHQTASGSHAAAYATYPDPADAGTGGALLEDHDFIAQRGAVITVVHLESGTGDGKPNHDYLVSVKDQTVLNAVADHLSIYGAAS